MIRDPEKILKKAEKLKGERGNWEQHWQEIADFIVPRKNDFNNFKAPGQKRNAQILDNTGMQSAELLAGTLHGLLLNPATLFFELTTGDDRLDQIDAVRLWLQETAIRMHNGMNNSNFQTEAHEYLLDLVGFCTAGMTVLEDDEFDMVFQTHFLKELYICENQKGLVDEVYRCFEWEPKKIISEFGEKNCPKSIVEAFENNREEKFEIVHVTYPLDSYGDTKPPKNFRFPIVSQYIASKDKHQLRLKGYHEEPWMVSRWAKASGEVYGRGPGTNALPEVKMANLMEDVMIRGAQKVIDPPLQVPDDGFVMPLKTRPGGVNFRRAGAGRTDGEIKPIFNNAQVDFGVDMMRDRRARIRGAFYIDQLVTPELNRQTATEVTKRAEEQLRFLGPLVGRLDVEFLRPLIERVYPIMQRRGRFSPPPPELRGRKVQVRFSSAIAKMQRVAEAENIFKVLNLIGPFVAMDPQITDNFDGDAIVRGVAGNLSFPQQFLRNTEDRDKMRKAKAEAEKAAAEQQAQLNQAEVASKAVPAAAQAADMQRNAELEEI